MLKFDDRTSLSERRNPDLPPPAFGSNGEIALPG
jgi:hypothetical protein